MIAAPLHSQKLAFLKGIVGQSALLWIAQMAGILISVAAGIFITRALGPEGRGVYTWLLTLASVGASVALFGMDISNRRFAAAQPREIPALLRLNLWVIFVGGGLAAVVLGIIAYSQPASGQNPLLIALVMLSVPLGALPMALWQVLQAQGRISKMAWVILLPKVLMAAGAAFLLSMAWVSLSAALLVNFSASLLGAALPLWYLSGALREPGHLRPLVYLKTVWRTCSAAYAAGLGYYLMQKCDVLLVGLFLGKAATGYYGVASNMVDIMMTPVLVISGLLATRLAAGTGGLPRKVLGLTMLMTVSGCMFTYFVAPWVIPFLFGAAFTPAVPVLQLLCPAVVALAWFALMQNALTANGRPRHLPIPPIVGSVANITLNIVLIPRLGLAGACWASILAYSLAAVCATVLVQETLRLKAVAKAP